MFVFNWANGYCTLYIVECVEIEVVKAIIS